MKQLSAIILALALTACVNPGTGEKTNSVEEFGTIDPSPANRLQGQELTTPLLQFADSITKVYPNFYDNTLAAEKMSEAFKAKLGALPGILAGSKFELTNVTDVNGTAIVELKCNGDPINLSVHCVGFDREKAAKLSKTKQYTITGGQVSDYQPASYTSDVSIDLGDVFVRDLQVEEI